MAVNVCRICDNEFYSVPLVEYLNMPKSAQYLPDKDSIEMDKGINLKVCQCSGCGLVQLDSDPVHYYKEVIRAAGFSDEMINFRRRQFEEFITEHKLEGKKLIEIGCGTGDYLSIMDTFDLQCYGLEYSEVSVAECLRKGLNVSEGFIENSSFTIPDGPFNAFIMMSFLEHLPDPNSVLRGVWNNLDDGGIGIVEVPNFDMIIENNLFSEFISDHLFYFTRGTLSSALERNGYEIIEMGEIWYNYIISAVIRKRQRADISLLKQAEIKLKKEVDEFINSFEPGRVAIWGAGHQALTVMSLMSLKNRIRYVVDSADFKQGKYTPSTHIPIVPPDRLNTDPVDAVIIMAASYSDEVADIIKQKYKNKIAVAILGKKSLKIN